MENETIMIDGVRYYRAMKSMLEEGIHRGKLSAATPVNELALFLNAQLYGLMVA